jgi:hypothetical protein
MRGISRIVAMLALPTVVGLAAAAPAFAATTQITCTTESGTVVLKITANDAAADGLTTAFAASGVAQETLGVTCTDTTGTRVRVPNAIRFVCTNETGEVVFKIVVNRRAASGLGTAAKVFMREAGERLGVTCTVE